MLALKSRFNASKVHILTKVEFFITMSNCCHLKKYSNGIENEHFLFDFSKKHHKRGYITIRLNPKSGSW